MSKKNIFILIFLISLLAGVGIFYFYLKNIKINQSIINYIPEQTIFYADFDLKNKELLDFYENNFRGKTRFELLLKNSNLFGELSKYLINKSNKISLLIVNYENNSEPLEEKIWIISSNNIHELHALMPKDFNVSILNSKTIALSKSKTALRLIKKIDDLQKSTQTKALRKKISNNFSDKNFLNIYLSGKYLQNNSENSDTIFNLIFNPEYSGLNLDFEQDSFLNLETDQNKIIYNFNSVAKDKSHPEYSGLGAKKFNKQEDLLQFTDLKNNEIFATFFSPDLQNIFDSLINKSVSEEQKNIWIKKYNLDFENINKILNNSGIFLMQNRNNKIDNEDLFNFDKYNYALIIKTNFNPEYSGEKIKEQKENIKQIIKNILAFKNPVEQEKILPDKTKSIELIANPESITFIQENNLEILNIENFNFVITIYENYLILGNSKKLIQEILASEQTNFINCDFLTGNEALIMNTNKLTSGILSFIDKLIINFEQKNEKINLNGCLVW